jgi:hypothetical protein
MGVKGDLLLDLQILQFMLQVLVERVVLLHYLRELLVHMVEVVAVVMQHLQLLDRGDLRVKMVDQVEVVEMGIHSLPPAPEEPLKHQLDIREV